MINNGSTLKVGILRIEKKEEVSRFQSVMTGILSIVAALLVSAILVRLADASIATAFGSLWRGAFGSIRTILETLVRATPLILTGLAAAIAFKGRIWNIGADGQLFIGAMAGYWASQTFGGLPPFFLVFMIIVFSFLGGALWGGIAGFLRTRFKVDVIISTIMLNYIAIYFLSFMLSAYGPWREEGSFYQQTARLAADTFFPILVPRSRLHLGFLIAIFSAIFIYILLKKTPLGFEIRALGYNPKATRFKGTNLAKTVIIIMLISGGIAGLAGAGELFGIHHRLRPDISVGLGYTGIIVAMLARINPVGVIPVGILFGALLNGSTRMQIESGVPSALVFAIQAIVLLFYLGGTSISKYRLRRVKEDG